MDFHVEDKEKRKSPCHCRPNCNKLLSARGRRRHRAQVAKLEESGPVREDGAEDRISSSDGDSVGDQDSAEHLSQDEEEPWNVFAPQLSQSLSQSQQQYNEPTEPEEPAEGAFEPEEQDDSTDDDSDAEGPSADVFQFTMKDLDLDDGPGDDAEPDHNVSDEELRRWLKDHVGDDWERIYHDTRE
ncbi:hypothetical protein FRC00_004920 [Tulasnella sp. 408]|nr:hypothetical protein FRC00_004920 [Tulasnella sp. 408]